MLTYNQRYRPRTTREYTKSDLTVYDSAGNTALNALKVYGKSEVVDGEIKSAGDSGNIEVQTCGKNLLNPTKYYQRSGYTNLTVHYTNNVIQIGGITAGGRFIAWNIKTTPGEQVTITWSNLNNINGLAAVNTTKFVNEWAGYSGSIILEAGMTITSSTEWLQIFSELRTTEQGTASISELQVEKGTSATAYEPYNDTMATFSTGTPLRGIPDSDVRDVMAWDGSAGTVTKKCGEVDLGTLNNWNLQSAFNIFSAPISTIYIPTSLSSRNHLLCSKYTAYAGTIDDQMPDKAISTANGNVYIKDEDYTTVEDFVASLGDAELVYELATPTTTPLTQTENESIASLRTFDGTTHFTNNAATDMTVNYTIKVPTIS